MRQILVWVSLIWFVLSLTYAQDLQPHMSQIRLKLKVGGHESLKPQLQQTFEKELRALKGVVLVEKDAAFQVKIDGMQTNSKGFVVSIIMLDTRGLFLANDIGFGTNHTELKKIAQKIAAQIDTIYLVPLKNPKQIATSNHSIHQKVDTPQPIYTSLGAHWIMEKMEGGRFIKLEDNSLWEISPYDRPNSHLWLPYEEVFIIETDEDDYPYQLMNKNNEDTASAKLIGQ